MEKEYLITFSVSIPGVFGIKTVRGSCITRAASKLEAIEKELAEAKTQGIVAEIISVEEIEP
jgi:lysophospholipid acyltransferase (LPLAT)-like uncharacterized protein